MPTCGRRNLSQELAGKPDPRAPPVSADAVSHLRKASDLRPPLPVEQNGSSDR
jgi:hypothetical protein